jgi:lipopolysaccharide/colanic/teichoic acid biosynthesis glycosyltransferase
VPEPALRDGRVARAAPQLSIAGVDHGEGSTRTPVGPARRWERARPIAKRAFDVVGSGIGVIVLSPVLAVISLAILVTDGRPLIYRSPRAGRDGRAFMMYKFRSMVADAPDRLDEVKELNGWTGPLIKFERDPRVTRIGHFLRATSLDELPQLFNVLRGSMSLVGPRPSLLDERERFPPELLEREALRPGITGPWQLEARFDPDLDRYRDLDLRYVRSYTLFGDVCILVHTPFVVLRDAWRHRAGRPELDH